MQGEQAHGGPALTDSVFGACELTLADFCDAVRHEPRTRRFVRLATVAGLALGALGVTRLEASHTTQGFALLGLGMLAMLAHNAPEHIASRWYARTPAKARALRYTLSPRGLVVVSELSNAFHAWESLYGFSEGPYTFLVWLDSRVFVIIPKRAFSPADTARAAALLRAHVGDKPSDAIAWLPLLVALGAGALAYALWSWLSPR